MVFEKYWSRQFGDGAGIPRPYNSGLIIFSNAISHYYVGLLRRNDEKTHYHSINIALCFAIFASITTFSQSEKVTLMMVPGPNQTVRMRAIQDMELDMSFERNSLGRRFARTGEDDGQGRLCADTEGRSAGQGG